MPVLDSSAVLAFLGGEAGADSVEEVLEGAIISAANWSEIAQKTVFNGGDWGVASSLLASYGVEVVSVTQEDAELAASLWTKGSGLSLADRLCLALSLRIGEPAITADSAWGASETVVQIR